MGSREIEWIDDPSGIFATNAPDPRRRLRGWAMRIGRGVAFGLVVLGLMGAGAILTVGYYESRTCRGGEFRTDAGACVPVADYVLNPAPGLEVTNVCVADATTPGDQWRSCGWREDPRGPFTMTQRFPAQTGRASG